MSQRIRTPNFEQSKAIEHFGGMILNAGAGSGKTFVLQKHLIFLIEKFLEKNREKSEEQLSRSLASFLSKIVFMTFTKKAAGELSGRIKEEVSARTEKCWKIVESQISHLFVGTIHGFCSQLISQGYMDEIVPEIKILTRVEYREKIFTLVQEFYEKVGFRMDIAEIILANLEVISKGMCEVFNSVELRNSWGISKFHDNLEFESFMDQLTGLLGIGDLLKATSDEFIPLLKNNWAKNLINFLNLFQSLGFKEINAITKYWEFFSEIKLSPPKNHLRGKMLFLQMAKLKHFLKEKREDLLSFYQNPKMVASWSKFLLSLFKYIDSQWSFKNGMTYSDLENIVLKSLQNPLCARRVRENFSYFVVDEFQDTSKSQSQIFKLLIEDNFEKLFCVGDLKQAIYGFRGGEIGVFLQYLEQMPLKEELKNNYRAGAGLIDFCNSFFDHVFFTSSDFSESKESVIPVHHQAFPSDSLNKNIGEINCLQIEVPDIDSSKNIDLERAETQGILELIKNIRSQFPGEEICILYKTRDPSMSLVLALLEDHLPFTAQVGITEKSDPILGIFQALLEAQILYIQGGPYQQQLNILIASYLDYLGIPVVSNLEQLFLQFINDQKIFGMLESTRKFFFSLNISNSNFSNNFSLLNSVIVLSKGNPEEILANLDNDRDAGYIFDFQVGQGAGLIKIMTVHASKGLEFDHVILGGIHTDRVNRGGQPSLFGQSPASFLWKMNSAEKNFRKTPQYILDRFREEDRDNLESKRLLYVAVTRAKKSLSYVEIKQEGKENRSWINAFKLFDDRKKIKTTEKPFYLKDIPQRKMERAFFHRDKLGLVGKKGQEEISLAILGNISVTTLASLVDCPRKFYLKNICKLDEKSVISEEENMLSSSERGSQIHLVISEKIKENDFSKHPDHAISFALKYLNESKNNYEIFSERILKFPIFGYMCSGIPDAILRPMRQQTFCVVDFKTGAKNASYHHFQLQAYAYGAYQLGMLDKNDEIKLVLLYLDYQEVEEVRTDFSKISLAISDVWKKLYALDQVNLQHCKECSFFGFCHPSVASN